MKKSIAPEWSFLAIEPSAREAKRKQKREFELLFAKRATLAQRKEAFWSLFESAKLLPDGHLNDAILRSHKAIQFFFALIDLSELRDMPDREMQRWMNAICGVTVPLPTHAVVQTAGQRVKLA